MLYFMDTCLCFLPIPFNNLYCLLRNDRTCVHSRIHVVNSYSSDLHSVLHCLSNGIFPWKCR